jgi:hypothetical protein
MSAAAPDARAVVADLTINRRTALLAVCLLALASFAPTVRFGFVYDDVWTVVENGFLRTPRLGALFAGRAFAQHVPDADRPLMVLSALFDVRIFGTHAWGHHVVRVLEHVATSALVFLFAEGLGLSLVAAGAAAILFAVHPAHVEAVAVVSFREDILAAMFALAACVLLLRGRGHPRRNLYRAGAVALRG